MTGDEQKKRGRRATTKGQAKPSWLKMTLPGGANYSRVKGLLQGGCLHTVCEEARCPNQGECWNAGTATFLILGEICTRGCRFCAVKTGQPKPEVDPEEPARVGAAAKAMELKYAVITSVDRDDLGDGGAAHFARTIEALREAVPGIGTEVLTPDFGGSTAAVATVLAAAPEVFAHNLETVRELTPRIRDRRCTYDRSLEVLAAAKEINPRQVIKSGLMLGMEETRDQILSSLTDLRQVGVEIVTLGQYLQPTARHLPVTRYIPPEEFAELGRLGEEMGFAHVASAPLVRSSYQAAMAYEKAIAGQ